MFQVHLICSESYSHLHSLELPEISYRAVWAPNSQLLLLLARNNGGYICSVTPEKKLRLLHRFVEIAFSTVAKNICKNGDGHLHLAVPRYQRLSFVAKIGGTGVHINLKRNYFGRFPTLTLRIYLLLATSFWLLRLKKVSCFDRWPCFRITEPVHLATWSPVTNPPNPDSSETFSLVCCHLPRK